VSLERFYNYHGSETRPPCHEEVTWIITGTLCEVSKDFYQNIEDLIDRNGRDTQPLNNRHIFDTADPATYQPIDTLTPSPIRNLEHSKPSILNRTFLFIVISIMTIMAMMACWSCRQQLAETWSCLGEERKPQRINLDNDYMQYLPSPEELNHPPVIARPEPAAIRHARHHSWAVSQGLESSFLEGMEPQMHEGWRKHPKPGHRRVQSELYLPAESVVSSEESRRESAFGFSILPNIPIHRSSPDEVSTYFQDFDPLPPSRSLSDLSSDLNEHNPYGGKINFSTHFSNQVANVKAGWRNNVSIAEDPSLISDLQSVEQGFYGGAKFSSGDTKRPPEGSYGGAKSSSGDILVGGTKYSNADVVGGAKFSSGDMLGSVTNYGPPDRRDSRTEEEGLYGPIESGATNARKSISNSLDLSEDLRDPITRLKNNDHLYK